MTATACMLAAVLMVEAAAAPATEECPVGDNRCQAKLYERRAGTAANAHHRALYLFNASKSYLFLFDKTGDARDLCAARRGVDASLRVRGQPPALRAQSETLRDTLAARVQQAHAQCGGETRARDKRADAPLVARRPAAASEPPADLLPRPEATPEPPTPDAGSNAATATPATPPIELRLADADPPSPATTRPQDTALMPVPSGRMPTERPATTPRPGRGLVLAGGFTLGVGVALTATAGVIGRRMLDTRRQLFALDNTIDTYATTDQATTGNALLREHDAMNRQTLALALASGATVLVAAVLVSVGGRRMARAASRTALVPAPGGVVFHARF